ncbi:hypothetical protein MN608_06083 [Microdochium nivale]|nr:hypothetical protein MN608_06083 [Microdochium nivale]
MSRLSVSWALSLLSPLPTLRSRTRHGPPTTTNNADMTDRPVPSAGPEPGPEPGPGPGRATFLTLPLELRLEVFKHLLVDPFLDGASSSSASSHPSSTTSNNSRKNAAAILRTSRQIHHEAMPILYSTHTFLSHPGRLLTHFPRLSASHAPVAHAEHSPLIASLMRRFRISLRLDVDPAFTAADAASHFSRAAELTVDVSQASWRAAPPDSCRLFEGVRGVGRAKVTGSVGGFEAYARWLEQVMMSPPGSRAGRFRGVMELPFDRPLEEDEEEEEEEEGCRDGGEEAARMEKHEAEDDESLFSSGTAASLSSSLSSSWKSTSSAFPMGADEVSMQSDVPVERLCKTK